MPQDSEKNENVVKLADARKRQRTTQRAGANGKHPPGGKAPRSRGPQPLTGWKKAGAYLQLLLFLAVLAYFMRQCRT
jgi:hypothetical protein